MEVKQLVNIFTEYPDHFTQNVWFKTELNSKNLDA